MINRRDILKMVAAAGLLSQCSTGLAQSRQKRTAKKKERTQPAQGGAPGDGRLSDLLEPIRDEFHLPGLVGAILIGDRLAATGAIGIKKIGSSQPIQITDQMHIGSCTKAMTATMIGSLVEEGKLSWNSTFRSGLSREFRAISSAVPGSDALATAHPPRWLAPRWPVVELARSDTDRATACALGRHAGARAFEPARLDLCLLKCGIRPGRLDGRACFRRVVGNLDATTALRAAGNGVRRIRHAGPSAERSRSPGAIISTAETSSQLNKITPRRWARRGPYTARSRIGPSLPHCIWRENVVIQSS